MKFQFKIHDFAISRGRKPHIPAVVFQKFQQFLCAVHKRRRARNKRFVEVIDRAVNEPDRVEFRTEAVFQKPSDILRADADEFQHKFFVVRDAVHFGVFHDGAHHNPFGVDKRAVEVEYNIFLHFGIILSVSRLWILRQDVPRPSQGLRLPRPLPRRRRHRRFRQTFRPFRD